MNQTEADSVKDLAEPVVEALEVITERECPECDRGSITVNHEAFRIPGSDDDTALDKCMKCNGTGKVKVKICTWCLKEKLLSEFWSHCKNKDGLSTQCKDCMKAKAREYRRQNKEKITQHQRVYRRQWYLRNKERELNRNKNYTRNNPEKMQQIHHDKYIRNKDLRQVQIEERRLIRQFGSLDRYNEALNSYDGWCAFACDRQAQLVHHLDGVSIHTNPGLVNNELSNLLPLCRSCHASLHNKARNSVEQLNEGKRKATIALGKEMKHD